MSTNEADIAAINALYEKWILGLKNNDFELFISVWADDATRMEPNSPPITGIEQLRAHFLPFVEQNDIDSDVYGDFDVQVFGDWAFYRGNYTLDLTPTGGGPTTHMDGKWVDILKKQPDGTWMVYIDSVSDNKPPEVE
ncbi:MAG: SgcJ/EcaC family oxidoreductase [Anaerolineales bacterium]